MLAIAHTFGFEILGTSLFCCWKYCKGLSHYIIVCLASIQLGLQSFQQCVKTSKYSKITTKEGPIPLMFGLRKDHKVVQQEMKDKGPPTKPVCGASSSIDGPLSHTISEILIAPADEMDSVINSECRSTSR